MSDSDFVVFPLFGFGAGIYCFFKGFKDFRNYRLMADTPLLPIRSLAMGRVEIYGIALGEQTLTSPVSNTTCFWYKVEIEKRVRDSKGNESWSSCVTDIQGHPFYLDDTTAKVLVDPKGADVDIEQWRQVERSQDDYSLTANLMPYIRSFPKSVGGTGRFRLTEYVIIPGEKYHVSGTCAENPAPNGEDDRNIVCKGETEPYFHISHRTEKEDEKNLRSSALWYIFGGAALTVVCAGVLMLEWVFS